VIKCSVLSFICILSFELAVGQLNPFITGNGLLPQLPPMGATFFGGGVSTFDVDHDGWDDLTLGISGQGIFVLKNNESVFDYWFFLPATGDVKQCLWSDFNNDGFEDLFACTAQGEIFIYQNFDNEYFVNVSAELNSQLPNSNWFGATSGDLDRDGKLDLYICAYNGQQNALLRNESIGNDIYFVGITNTILTNTQKSSFQPVLIDLNNDNVLDLFISNDFNQGNDYYQSIQGSQWVELDDANGLDFPIDAMSNSWSDFDLDQDMDVLITDTDGSYLLRNDGGVFSPVINDVDVPFWNWSALWVDWNNDFYDDLLITGNNLTTNTQENFLLHNINGEFIESMIAPQWFGDNRFFGAAKGDFNHDKKSDLVLAPDESNIPNIMMNNAVAFHSVTCSFEGTWSNRNAFGLKYKSYSGNKCKSGQLFSGENYLSQNSQNIILPVCSDCSKIDSLLLLWPSGHQQVIYNLFSDSSYHIVEGNDLFPNGILKVQQCNGGEVVLSVPPLLMWSEFENFGFTFNLNLDIGISNEIYCKWANGRSRKLTIEWVTDQWNLISVFSNDNCINAENFLSTWFEHDSFGIVDSMSWSLNFEDQISLILIDPSGCTWSLDTNFFHLADSGFVQILPFDILCENEQLILDDYFLSSAPGNWMVDGDLEPTYLSPGSHSVQYLFDSGCIWDTTITITQVPLIEPLLTWSLTESCVLFNLTVDSVLVENVLWNDSIWASSICYDLVPEMISYLIIDEFGCEHTFSENLDVSLSMNITQEEINILRVSYYDTLGRIIYTGSEPIDPIDFGVNGAIVEEVVYEGNIRETRRLIICNQ
jgi:hypothetical protein